MAARVARHLTQIRSSYAVPAPAKVPQQKSWASRHKVATGILIGFGVVFGGWLILLGANGCFQDDSCSF